MRAVLVSGETGATRYLSKNNNNILRLSSLRKAFPDALIIIPFRHPAAHAASLKRMHQAFTADQAEDAFVRDYMGWLAHHEFGGDHRPFRFDGFIPGVTPDTDTYWLTLWQSVYGWLLANAPEDAVFVCYEDLCADPAIWQKLAQKAGIDPGPAETGFSSANKPAPDAGDNALHQGCMALYEGLRARSTP